MDESINKIIEENEFTVLNINGKEFKIGKIKGFYYLKLAAFFGKIGKKYRKELEKFQVASTDIGDIFSLLQILDNNDGMELLSILLGIDDVEFCKNIDGEIIPDIIIAICKYNNFSHFKKKVIEMIEAIVRSAIDKTS
jgi:hypothetical protein